MRTLCACRLDTHALGRGILVKTYESLRFYRYLLP